MRKLKVFIACSIDGFIADENGGLDFLEAVQVEGEDYGYAEFCKDVDTVIIGRKTYDTLVELDIPFPHEGLMCYVFTHTRKPETRHVRFITEDPIVFALGLKSQRGGSISDEDYPSSSIRNEEAGTSVATFTIGTDGKVTSCNASGASPTLDAETCKLIIRRFRFKPALDTSGQPIAETKSQRVTWRLPK
jgi:hypothetical protein